MADQKFTIDVSQALAQLQGVDRALAGLQNKFKETGEKANRPFVEGTEGALKEAQAIDRLQKEYDDLARAVARLKAAQKNATDPRAINNFATEIAKGEAGLRRYEQAAKSAGVSLNDVSRGAGTTAEVVDGLVGSFTKGTVILAVLSEVAALIKSVVSLSDQIGRAEIQFRNFTGSAESAKEQVAQLVDFANRKFLNTEDVLAAGKSLLAFGIQAEDLEDSLSRIADISAATGKNFNELAVIYGKARTAGVLYAEDINQLVDAGIPIIQEFAKQLGVSESEVKKLASEGRISFEELQLAFINLTKEGATFAGQAESQAQTFSGAWTAAVNSIKQLFLPVGEALKNFLTDAANGINIFVKTLGNLRTEFGNLSYLESINPAEVFRAVGRAQTTARNEIFNITQQSLEEEEKARQDQANKLIAAEQAAAAKRLELQKQENAKKASARAAARKKELEEIQKFEEEKQRFLLSIQPEGIDKDLALAKARYQANLNEAKRFGVDSAAVEEQYWNEINEIIERYAGQTAQTAADGLKQRLQEQENTLTISKQLADLDIQLQEERYAAAINALRGQGVDEERLRQAQAAADVRIQRLRLENEIKFQTQKLEVLRAAGDQQADVIAKNIEVLQAQLNNLPSTLGADPAGTPEGQTRSLFDLLGINLNEDQQNALNTALEQATGAIINSIQQISAARVQAANVALQSAEEQVKAAETALAKELELQEKGFASNVTLRQRELAEAKKAREKAVEEQRKAQRTQILLDTALQASSLATTVANLFKSLSALPLGTGVPIAIALSATMFAAFAKAKADALRATRARFGMEGGFVGKDGIVRGRMHSQGGEMLNVERGELVQVSDDGKRRRLSVVRRERAAQYHKLLDAANRNDKEEIKRQAFALAGIDPRSVTTNEGDRINNSQINQGSIYYDILKAAEKNDQKAVIKNAFALAGIDPDQYNFYRNESVEKNRAYNTSFDYSKLDQRSIIAPAVNAKKVGKAIDNRQQSTVLKQTINTGASDGKQTALLQAILYEMQKQGSRETWTPDGSARIRGNVKTIFTK